MRTRRKIVLSAAAAILLGTAGAAVASNNLVYQVKDIKAAKAYKAPRIINFGGFLWKVRDTAGDYEEPSDGAWSDSANNVSVDSAGALHLGVTVVDGKRVSAEIDSLTPFSYGTYKWKIKLAPAQLDRYTVLGLYTYAKPTNGAFNEIDIEHGKFFDPSNVPSQFVVQPYQVHGHLYRYKVPPATVERIEQFDWEPNGITFTVSDAADPSVVIAKWSFADTASIPAFQNDSLHMNFWSYRKLAKGQPVKPPVSEAVIESFNYTPSLNALLHL